VIRLKRFDLPYCPCGYASRVSRKGSSSFGVEFVEDRKLRSLWVGGAELSKPPDGLIQRGTKAVKQVSQDQRNVIGRIGNLDPNLIPSTTARRSRRPSARRQSRGDGQRAGAARRRAARDGRVERRDDRRRRGRRVGRLGVVTASPIRPLAVATPDDRRWKRNGQPGIALREASALPCAALAAYRTRLTRFQRRPRGRGHGARRVHTRRMKALALNLVTRGPSRRPSAHRALAATDGRLALNRPIGVRPGDRSRVRRSRPAHGGAFGGMPVESILQGWHGGRRPSLGRGHRVARRAPWRLGEGLVSASAPSLLSRRPSARRRSRRRTTGGAKRKALRLGCRRCRPRWCNVEGAGAGAGGLSRAAHRFHTSSGVRSGVVIASSGPGIRRRGARDGRVERRDGRWCIL